MRNVPSWLIVGAGGLIAASASAANLVTNPDFSDGLNGWTTITPGNGIAALDDTTGLPLAPSLHMVSDPATADVNVTSSCMPVDDRSNYDLYMNIKGSAGFALAAINFYSDTACTTGLSTVDTDSYPATDEWGTYSTVNVSAPDGAQSANIVLTATMGSSAVADDVNFDHIEFGASGTVPAAVNVNQEGLTGTWYNPATSGQGMQFQFSPDTTTPGAGTLFGTWYTYDISSGSTDTQRWYSVQSALMGDAGSANVTIYQNTGGNFDAAPVTSAVPVGTGTLTFDSCETGSFDYSFDDGRTGTIPMQRLLPNVECVETGTPTNPVSDFGYSGAWYNTGMGGQGVLIEINPNDAQAFLGWYTYAADGESSGASGQRWFTAQSPYTVGTTAINLTIYVSTGGVFNSGGIVTTNAVGTATLTFTDCQNATLEYAFIAGELNGRSGTIPLSRLGATPQSCTNSVPN